MWNDIRYAFRSLLRERAFASMAVLSLAVGIGANTAIFSVVNGVLLRPLPYREPQRLVSIREVVPKLAHLYPSLPVNFSHYYEWRQHCPAFESIALLWSSSPNLTGAGEPELLNGARVSASIFRVLGVYPRLGRGFVDEEDPEGHDQVVVLSDSLWKRRFNADPAIIGRKITIDGKPNVVVGVLPAGFQFPMENDSWSKPGLGSKTEILQPLGYSKDDLEEINGDYNWSAIARLRPGISRAQALAGLNVIQSRISARIPEKMDLHASMIPLQDDIVQSSRRGLLVVLGAVGAVLLILCVNLANLSLARAAGRSRESAIRTALGAGRTQLLRQALTESLVLSVLGGLLGIALAAAGVPLLLHAAPLDLPRLAEVSMDGRVLAFALLISLVTGAAFGILPALRSSRAHPQDALKSVSYTTTENRRGVRVRNVLVAMEAAFSAALLIAAGLLTASFVRLMHVDKGFNIERVLAVRVKIPPDRYNLAQQSAFYDRLLEKTRPLPGVLSTGLVSALPFEGETWIDLASAENDQRPMFERPMVNVRFVSPDYFRTLRIPFRAGAPFNNSQRNRPVVIVSEGTARRLWPGQDPIGRRLIHNEKPEEVVGVTADVRSTSLDKDPVLIIYVPYWQRPRLSAALLVRTAMDPLGIAAGIRDVIHQLDADVPVPPMQTLQEVMSDSVAQRRFQMMLIAIFAAAALALAGFGIYGVVSYSVTRRRTEMGIRMALGAGSGGLQRMVLWQAIRPVAAGLALGILMALAAGRALSSLLFQVSARDPLTIAAVAAVLLAVSVAAAWVPARRATRVDPMSALRFE